MIIDPTRNMMMKPSFYDVEKIEPEKITFIGEIIRHISSFFYSILWYNIVIIFLRLLEISLFVGAFYIMAQW